MFYYFDMGNVVLHFDHRRAARQMADVAGVPLELVWELVFGSGGLNRQLDLGQLDSQQFHAAFCRETKSAPTYDSLIWAFSDIFEPNWPLWPVLANLGSAGYRLGLLSNTCAAHWQFVGQGRYRLLREGFERHVLSYEIHQGKPDPAIYATAAALAGVAPETTFFVDDVPQHVAAAQAAGWDAVVYRSVPELVHELHRRGAVFNY